MARIGLTGLLIFFVLLGGCNHGPEGQPVKPPVAHSAVPITTDPSNAWWSIQFRITWPPGSEPNWTVDALVADVVIAPVLVRYRNAIALWRFQLHLLLPAVSGGTDTG